MAWTYTGNPASSDKDAIRFLVGDTKTDTQLATDEEIAWALAQANNDQYTAASIVARGISAYFSTLADSTEIGPIKIVYGKRAEYFANKASELENKSSFSQTLNVYVGGISKQERKDVASDNKLTFALGMHDSSGQVGISGNDVVDSEDE